ncbi:hypothetical protein GCM10027217_18230 [Pseudomaricurvus hydrocarbonicus]
MQQKFKGERITLNQRISAVKTIRFTHPKNSGAGAMVLAENFGARRIILLGFDCQYSADGIRHWHGDHPKGLGNAVSMPKWYPQFRETAGLLGHCDIINATRSTALDFWPKQPLEQALADTRHSLDRTG